jgi:multicomponent Na+:H+ antiporter subunit F
VNWILGVLLACLAIPLFDALRSDTLWEKLLAYATVTTKGSVLILAVGVLRHDPMTAMVGVVALSLGNAGLMLLAYVIQRLEVPCD